MSRIGLRISRNVVATFIALIAVVSSAVISTRASGQMKAELSTKTSLTEQVTTSEPVRHPKGASV